MLARIGRPGTILPAGSVAALSGVVAVLAISAETSAISLRLRPVLVGFGMGPALNLLSQSAAERSDVGAVTALSKFSRQIGA